VATLSRGQTFGATESITNTKLHNLVDLGSISALVNADIAAAAAIAYSKLADIDGSKLTGLANIPSGAGSVPAANLTSVAQKGANSDITSLTGLTTPLALTQGGTGLSTIVANQLLLGTASNTITAINAPNPVVQIVNTQTGAVATGTTAIPDDDTIPQNTEGDEYMTLAIAPKSATNKLKIDVVAYVAHTLGTAITCALFQDATAGALAAGQRDEDTPGNVLNPVVFSHYMVAGTTSATTFKIRMGGATGATTTFNGHSSARKLGGVIASSITITELYSAT